MEVIITMGEIQLLQKLRGKRTSYETVRLEIEVVIFKMALEWLRDDRMVRLVMQKRHMKLFAKNPI